MVLVGALWIMAFLALVVVSFVASQAVELRVAGAHADRTQALHLAASGIEHAKAVLLADETAYDGPHDDWITQPEIFERVPLGEGFYSLIRPPRREALEEDANEIAFGLDDENAKVNLNTAPLEVLKELPGMTDALAEALIDWRDEDDEVTGEGGAESDHYERLTPPYAAKNGLLDSVEELLLVKGFTTEILYGEDANRNGVLDPSEDDGDESLPPDDHDGELDGGLTEFVTVYSYFQNRSLEGKPRVNINEADRETLTQALGEQLPPPKITWILEYRKAKFGGQSIFPDEKYATPVNVVPLIPVPGVPGQPLTFDDYRKIADLVTVTSEDRIEGKINVNTAPKEVLQALPQITDEEVDEILAERENEERDLAKPTWVYAVLLGSGMEKLAKYSALEPFIDVRSRQFTVQAVGVVPGRGVMARIVAVIDRTVSPPQLLYWKDISGLGLAFHPPTREAWDSEAGEGH